MTDYLELAFNAKDTVPDLKWVTVQNVYGAIVVELTGEP